MPNWSENRLTVYGVRNPEQFKDFINTGVNDGVWRMSNYNPMPEELVNTISPPCDRKFTNEWDVKRAKIRLSEQPDNIKKFEDKLSNCEPEMVLYYTRKLEKSKEPIVVPKLIKSNNSTPEDCEYLVEKYGYDNWYDWCSRNWGTKWDATAEEDDHTLSIEDNMVTIEFQTAWSVPEGLLSTVQTMYPDLLIECTFIDEGGTPAGVLYTSEYDKGVLISEYSDEGVLMKDDSGTLYYYDEGGEVYMDMDDNTYTEDEFWEFGAYHFNPMSELDLWFYELIK